MFTFYIASGQNSGLPRWSSLYNQRITTSSPSDYLGSSSLALTPDGTTLIAGAEGDDTSGVESGASYVYTLLGSTYTLQAKLEFSGASARAGRSVALSIDGNYAVVGAPEYDGSGGSNTGVVDVWKRTGTSWAIQQSIARNVAFEGFGSFVALNSDATTLGICYSATSTIGIDIYIRSGTTWSNQGTLYDATSYYPCNIALSGDGNTCLVGYKGSIPVVYTRSGSTWSKQGTLSLPVGLIVTPPNFGSIALSKDGNTAIIGVHSDPVSSAPFGNGYVFVYTRSGSVWSYRTTITAIDGAEDDGFGATLSISPDPTEPSSYTLVIGAPRCKFDSITNLGASYIYYGKANNWLFINKLQPTDQLNDSFVSGNPSSPNGPGGAFTFGNSVAINLAGTIAVLGSLTRGLFVYLKQ